MVIEYIGTIIRNEVANRKEKLYESQVWGCSFTVESLLALSNACKMGQMLPGFRDHEKTVSALHDCSKCGSQVFCVLCAAVL